MSKLRKKIGKIIAYTGAGTLIFLILSPILMPTTVMYFFNTTYAKAPYSSSKLEKIMIGDTIDQVRNLLGEPLSIDNLDFNHGMLFTDGYYQLNPEFHSVGGGRNEPFLGLWFSERSKVNYVFNSDYTKMEDTELLGWRRKRFWSYLVNQKSLLRSHKPLSGHTREW